MCRALCSAHSLYPGKIWTLDGTKREGRQKRDASEHSRIYLRLQRSVGRRPIKWKGQLIASHWPVNTNSTLILFFLPEWWGRFSASSHVNWHRLLSAGFISTSVLNKSHHLALDSERMKLNTPAQMQPSEIATGTISRDLEEWKVALLPCASQFPACCLVLSLSSP